MAQVPDQEGVRPARAQGLRVAGVADARKLAALPLGDLVAVVLGGGSDAADAWGVLVEGHATLVWKVVRCFGLSKEASWDAYQSTWLRAVERLDTLRDPERFPGWLATIARREALGVIRTRNKLVPTADLTEPTADDPPPDDRPQRHELQQAVREGFARLPRECQDLLRLLSADPPVPYKEIEQLLDMPRGSIGPTRSRCLEKLRKTPPMVAFIGPEG
jgi:RNA polymerase sigma factor (sigma-70 family)